MQGELPANERRRHAVTKPLRTCTTENTPRSHTVLTELNTLLCVAYRQTQSSTGPGTSIDNIII